MRTRTILTSLWLLALGAGATLADERNCDDLRARLDDLPVTQTEIYGRYDHAVAEQRQELQNARQRAGSMGCGFTLGDGASKCDALNVKIERMESNLDALQHKRTELATNRSDTDAGKGIEAALRANGCLGPNGQRTAAFKPLPGEGNLFDMLNSDRSDDVTPFDSEENIRRVPQDAQDDIPQYRTICVRTCDGYYFPMSPMSSRNDFARDQQNCQSICPAADVRAYYQPAGEDDPSTMLSAITEEPYPDLATAYLYKRSDVPVRTECSCSRTETPRNYSVIGGAAVPLNQSTIQGSVQTIMPASEPEPDARPELRGAQQGVEPNEGDRKVRVVGPEFLPAR